MMMITELILFHIVVCALFGDLLSIVIGLIKQDYRIRDQWTGYKSYCNAFIMLSAL